MFFGGTLVPHLYVKRSMNLQLKNKWAGMVGGVGIRWEQHVSYFKYIIITTFRPVQVMSVFKAGVDSTHYFASFPFFC